jgi:hypothetical protein
MKTTLTTEVKQIDITPTWEGCTRAMIAVLECSSSSEDAKEIAREEILKMATFIDNLNKDT